ncbi:MAG: 3-oxoacyl-ACP reductase FabG, partial [Treponema sp.]|nr:3-oxoacyl-ACP reductase FabG [Treponema sp.]
MQVETEKTVLITGASRGIGKAIALEAARAGYTIVAHYNKGEQAAQALKDEILSFGGKAELIQFDIADRESCREKLNAFVESYGTPWGVICNAGICADNAFPALTDEDWDSVIHTNLDGFYNVLHPLVMPLCRKKRGRIITIASVSGVMGNRGQVNYSASKAGIIGATKALAVELASRSITVNCIAPGIIETDMIKSAPLDMILPSIPMGRLGK